MDTNTQETGSGCCAKSKCCGGKALAAIALLALGATGGYFCARHCAAPTAAAVAPAAPTK